MKVFIINYFYVRQRTDSDGYSSVNSPMSVSTRYTFSNNNSRQNFFIIYILFSYTDVEMSDEQYINTSYRYVKEVYDSFITKLITCYSMYSQEKCDEDNRAPVKINNKYVVSASEAVENAKDNLRQAVNDLYPVKEDFMLDDIKNWVRDVHLKTSPFKDTLVESVFSLFHTYDMHLTTLTDKDLLKYANEAADNILKYVVGHNRNFEKNSIIDFVISTTANNTSNVIEHSFGELFMLFGSSQEGKKRSLYTGPDIKAEKVNFEESLQQVKDKFKKQEYDESEWKNKINRAQQQVKEALKEIEKKYHLKSVADFIEKIDNFKSTMENKSKKEDKKPEATTAGKIIRNDVSHNKKIQNLTMNM